MRKRLLRFVDAVTGEVEDSVCQQIKLSAAYQRVNIFNILVVYLTLCVRFSVFFVLVSLT